LARPRGSFTGRGTPGEGPTSEVGSPLPEQEMARVEPGQAVELKVRALPYRTFWTWACGGPHPAGALLLDRVLGHLRTEFRW
jgi:hypothetical protein